MCMLLLSVLCASMEVPVQYDDFVPCVKVWVLDAIVAGDTMQCVVISPVLGRTQALCVWGVCVGVGEM